MPSPEPGADNLIAFLFSSVASELICVACMQHLNGLCMLALAALSIMRQIR